MVPLGVSFSLQIKDQGLIKVPLSPFLDLFDSYWFMLCPWAMSFFQKLCPAPFPPVPVGTIPWRGGSTPVFLGFPCGSAGKESACNVGDPGSIPGWGKSAGEGKGCPLVDLILGSGGSPGEGNGNLLQCSCLGNPRDRGVAGRKGAGHNF